LYSFFYGFVHFDDPVASNRHPATNGSNPDNRIFGAIFGN